MSYNFYVCIGAEEEQLQYGFVYNLCYVYAVFVIRFCRVVFRGLYENGENGNLSV